MCPNSTSYNICIDAYARRGDHQKAESILEEMILLSNQGEVGCQPSIHSFASVVSLCIATNQENCYPRLLYLKKWLCCNSFLK